MGTIHRIPRPSGCPHDVKPHRVLSTLEGREFIAYCNVCGEELGVAPTVAEAEALDATNPPDAVDSALRLWRHEGAPILEAARVYGVSPEHIILAFKDEDPKAYYISMAKAIVGVGLALAYTNLKNKLRRARQRRLGK